MTALSSMRIYDYENRQHARLEVGLFNLYDQAILLFDPEHGLFLEIAIPPRPGWLIPSRAIIPVEVVFRRERN